MSSIEELVDSLKLEPHPEGGFYKETYRSTGIIANEHLPSDFNGNANFSTAIYYLLRAQDCSRLHRLRSDEIFHHYMGGTLNLVEITPEGQLIKSKIGTRFSEGEVPQHVIKAGNWFGAYPAEGTDFVLVGCTVAPGFSFDNFELADKEALLSTYPEHDEIIERLV